MNSRIYYLVHIHTPNIDHYALRKLPKMLKKKFSNLRKLDGPINFQGSKDQIQRSRSLNVS